LKISYNARGGIRARYPKSSDDRSDILDNVRVYAMFLPASLFYLNNRKGQKYGWSKNDIP